MGNWKQVGLDLEFRGETYRWSKHHEFLKFLDTPRKVARPIELAMNLGGPREVRTEANEAVPAVGLGDDRSLLEGHGWRLVDAPSFTTDPWTFRI